MSTSKQSGVFGAVGTAASGVGGAINSLLASGIGSADAFASSSGNVLSNLYNHATPFPSGAAVQRLAAQQAATEATDARQSGGDIWMAGLGGLGAGVALTRLQQLLSGANKPDIKYKKFVPGSQAVDEDEKMAEAAPAAPNTGLLNALISAPGNLVHAIADEATNRATAKGVLMLGGSTLGLYGGHKLMQQIAQKQHKEELQDTVEDAKKEYQRALLGKRAGAELDTAFAAFEKASASGESSLPAGIKAIVGILDAAQYPLKRTNLHMPYWAANAGLGALSTKMMYDWTRERGKDKALAEAQKARARLAGAPSIYVDPEQLAKIKSVAD